MIEPGNTVAGWRDGGVAAAQAHAATPSVRDPKRSILSDAQYAQDMSDKHTAEGDELRAAYWAGYSAEAHRLDPTGERQLLTTEETKR